MLNQDGTLDENWFAKEIAQHEGKLEQVDIGQIKEVLKITLDILAEIRAKGDVTPSGEGLVDEILSRHM